MKLNLINKKICSDEIVSTGLADSGGNQHSSTTSLRLTDLEGLPSNNTMGPMSSRPLQDLRKNENHTEQTRKEMPGEFLKNRAPSGNM